MKKNLPVEMGRMKFLQPLMVMIVTFATYSVATETKVRAHVGSIVDLPCTVDVNQCGSLHSVKWYKDTSRIYVLSHAGVVTRPEGDDATDRMKVEYTPKSNKAVLRISSVRVEDEATYKCEITYLEVIENCDVVQIVKLNTLIVPESVRILGNDGVSMVNSSILGPKEEGTEVELICEALSGKPIPKVAWFNGTNEIQTAVYTTIDNNGEGVGTGRSKLHLTLSRGDLNARFECRVESDALDEPIISWITADVHVRPTKIELSGVKNHVVQGTNVLLICDVHGARPAAQVRWENGTDPITDKNLVQTTPEDNQISDKITEERDGTFTTKSSLIFKASHWENGRKFYCYSDNEVMRNNNEPELKQHLILDVRYPPVISVQPSNITVNENVTSAPSILLICNYFANPQELKSVVWSKDGKNLTLHDPNKYMGGTNDDPRLSIKNVTRDDMGDYACWLKNEVGFEQSEDNIFVNVQYPPDVEVVMEPSLPTKAIDRSTVLLECNVTSGNPSNLVKVRWNLNGELLREFPECNYTSFDEDGNGIGSGGPFCGLDLSILSLERVDESFAGNYTCQGRNIAGWGPESEPQELVVYYAPSPAKIRHYPMQVLKGASVTLECTVDNLGRPDNVTYIWYRGSHQMTEITTATFVVSPVRLETKSNFTCKAQNEGGQSENATEFVNVYAPPAFIQKLPTYQGVLYSSQNINLTCRVECSPICSIAWLKDGHPIDTNNNPLYYVKPIIYKPDLRKNDFESIESTLIWNMTSWPDNKLNRTAPNSNYTCSSRGNTFGAGVSSTIEIAVDYPPEELTVSHRIVHVIESQSPIPVKCHGKGHPALSYQWKKNATSEPIERSEELRLGSLARSDSGAYMCEASNKHGTQTAIVYFNVQYAPECSITTTEKDGSSALVCTANANPQEVMFTWKIRESNETSIESANIIQEGLKSYLILDSSVDTFRTYLCYANNSVGTSGPCERDVAGNLPWWKRLNQDKLIIIIAAIIAIIICVIIICIVIILLCRRKRADTKYNSPLEMEEREKPDGYSPTSDPAKWPLRPGVLVHVNKMNNVNISQISTRMSAFKTTSVSKTRSYLKYKRNKSKVYARLARFKELLGFRSHDHIPIGISEGASGVVTFKKFPATTPPMSPAASGPEGPTNSRKRKKPGYAPNPSSIGDKIRLGDAPPVGGSADPSNDPDKGFYENLPFHGMQNPPNKPISIIAPFTQGNTLHFTSSTKSLLPSNNTAFSTAAPFGTAVRNKSVKRNQSFHGFQNSTPAIFRSTFDFSKTISNPYLNSQFKFAPPLPPHGFYSTNVSQHFVPSIFTHLSSNFAQLPANNCHTIAGISPPQQNAYNKFASNNLINKSASQSTLLHSPFVRRNPFSFPPPPPPPPLRVVGRRESLQNKNSHEVNSKSNNKTDSEKRFHSLELKKHKCYSPTFYSMRCKKHAKKRPVIYALPKKCLSQANLSIQSETYDNLTDSIQISERSQTDLPIPAPRCKRHRKETIYQNVSKSLSQLESDSSLNVSNESACEKDVPVVVEAQVHATDQDDAKINQDAPPKLVAATAKPEINLKLSSHAIKNSPTLKVSPNFVKPKTESPKGALSLKIQAKRKASPTQTPNESPSTKEDENAKEHFPCVPQMPLIAQNKWVPNIANSNLQTNGTTAPGSSDTYIF